MSRLLEVDDLVVQYSVGRGRSLIAVDGVSLQLQPGAALGLVGESGCGKSSLARALAGVLQPKAGSVRLGGSPLGWPRPQADARSVQMVFQDPSSALNPALRVGRMLEELLLVHGLAADKGAARVRCEQLMHDVGLPVAVLDAKPRALSGGQRQRVGIARALALEPEVLIADEAVAALDSVVKKGVVELLQSLRRDRGISLVFISHDLRHRAHAVRRDRRHVPGHRGGASIHHRPVRCAAPSVLGRVAGSAAEHRPPARPVGAASAAGRDTQPDRPSHRLPVRTALRPRSAGVHHHGAGRGDGGRRRSGPLPLPPLAADRDPPTAIEVSVGCRSAWNPRSERVSGRW